jgi:TonB family protein
MPFHTLRSALRRLPVRASLYVFGAALACAAAAPAATAAAEGNSKAWLDFGSCAKPQYPHEDLKADHQGTVTLGFLVDETGHVNESKVAGSSGFTTLDEAARTALAMCTFHPALENGKPVAQWTQVKYEWTTH